MIGQTISHYKITAKLGESGIVVVYKVEDTKLDCPVTLKFLAPHLLRDSDSRGRFKREAKAAARLDDPNLCAVREIDAFEGGPSLSLRLHGISQYPGHHPRLAASSPFPRRNRSNGTLGCGLAPARRQKILAFRAERA